LIKGTKYWVVAKPTGIAQKAFEARWYTSNKAHLAYNRGTDWLEFPSNAPAFSVIAKATGTDGLGDQLALMATTDRARSVFGSNLLIDPCSGCNYDPNATGFPVQGSGNCPSSEGTAWLAVSFIAGQTGVPRRISASIIVSDPQSCPADKVTLSLYADDCLGVPGTLLASGEATVPTEPCDLAVAKLSGAPELIEGTKYWVAATTNDAQAELDANWYGSNNAQLGFDLGTGWIQFSANTPGFLVE
jgi:hypothetical protein